MAFKSILDEEFEYRNARSTDIRKTFERVKRERQLQQANAKTNQRDPSGRISRDERPEAETA